MKFYVATALLVAIFGTIISQTFGCSDLHPTKRCEELKQDGRCDKWKMMKERCQATCGFCKQKSLSYYPQNPVNISNYFAYVWKAILLMEDGIVYLSTFLDVYF